MERLRKTHQDAIAAVQRYAHNAQSMLRSGNVSGSPTGNFTRELSVLIQQLAEYCSQLEMDIRSNYIGYTPQTSNVRSRQGFLKIKFEKRREIDRAIGTRIEDENFPNNNPPLFNGSTLELQNFLKQKALQMGLDKIQEPRPQGI